MLQDSFSCCSRAQSKFGLIWNWSERLYPWCPDGTFWLVVLWVAVERAGSSSPEQRHLGLLVKVLKWWPVLCMTVTTICCLWLLDLATHSFVMPVWASAAFMVGKAMVKVLCECLVIFEQIGAWGFGNSKMYTLVWEGHEVKVTWPEQPSLMNGNSIVFYGMPVLVFLMCLIIMSKYHKLVSSGMYYMPFPPHHFKMQYIVLARTADVFSNKQLIGAGRIFKKR